MKTKLLILFSLLLFSSSLAQIETVQPVVDDGKVEIFQFIKELNFAIRNKDTLILRRYFSNKSDNSKEKFTQQKPFTHNSSVICSDINLITEDIYELNSDEATVHCLVILNGVEDFSNSNHVIKLKKKDGQWIIPDISENFEIIDFLNSVNINPQQGDSFPNPFVVRYSNSSLLQMKQYVEPDIWEINRAVTNQYFERQLYAYDSELDMELYWYGSNWPDDVAVFTLDPIWQRIVYSKKYSNDIKSYGDHTGNYKFSYPQAITMDDNGYIYVADMGNKKIVKLAYIPGSNIIGYSGIAPITNYVKSPTDIMYTRGSQAGKERFWIVDSEEGPIIVTDKNWGMRNIVTKYNYQGETYYFNHPTRVVCDKNATDYATIIDPNSKMLFYGYVNFVNTDIFYVVNLVKFPENSIITDVGKLPTGDLMVSDSYYNAVHKFTVLGEYVCSYKYSSYHPSAFQLPQRLSYYNHNKSGHIILENSTADRWSASYGLKRYLAGSDVFDLAYEQIPNSQHKFTFLATDWSKIRIEILQNNVVIKSQEFNCPSGITGAIFPYNDLPITTNLVYRVKHKPYYNDSYNSYQQDWRYKQMTFNTAIPPIISSLVQSPNPICRGGSGSVYAYLSQGSGQTQFFWDDEGSLTFNGATYTQIGNPCIINWPNSDNYGGDLGHAAYLICTAKNIYIPSLQYEKTINLNMDSPCPSCPTIAFEVDGEMTDDNPLLITSLSNPGVDVTDYYLVQNPITPIGNQINLRIHESQTEHTWLDYAELIVTRVKADELVAVNDEGEIINYKESTAPVTVLLNGETDITDILTSMDSIDIALTDGDVLTIIRSSQSPEDDGDGDIVLGGIDPIKDQESITLRGAQQTNIDGSIESKDGDDPPIGGMFFRPKRSVIAKSLRNVPSGNLEIEINKDLVLDYLAVVRNIRTARTRTLNLLDAVHSLQGDVKNLLSSIDQNYAEILPGESIDFNFQFDYVPSERIAFIIKTVGRYETDSTIIFKKLTGVSDEESVPIENELFDNYPNPFNPITQIKYSVKENGMVTLKVYDGLGKEVSSLANEEKQSGTYTATFDAGNLASGIYFYSIKSNNFYQTKKMLLIK